MHRATCGPRRYDEVQWHDSFPGVYIVQGRFRVVRFMGVCKVWVVPCGPCNHVQELMYTCSVCGGPRASLAASALASQDP